MSTKRVHWKQNAVNSRVRTHRSPRNSRHVTEVTRNCVHHLFGNIQTPTVLNMSGEIRIISFNLTFFIPENELSNSVKVFLVLYFVSLILFYKKYRVPRFHSFQRFRGLLIHSLVISEFLFLITA